MLNEPLRKLKLATRVPPTGRGWGGLLGGLISSWGEYGLKVWGEVACRGLCLEGRLQVCDQCLQEVHPRQCPHLRDAVCYVRRCGCTSRCAWGLCCHLSSPGTDPVCLCVWAFLGQGEVASVLAGLCCDDGGGYVCVSPRVYVFICLYAQPYVYLGTTISVTVRVSVGCISVTLCFVHLYVPLSGRACP